MFNYFIQNSSTALYPLARGLSNDTTIENIIADIPFFTVGILAFCTLSFFVAMRRLTLPSTYLHASILAAFIASILDLAQILSRGLLYTDLGIGLNSVWAIVIAREVGFTVSTGLRFLFFWAYVAEPPRAERNLHLTEKGVHSGSWNRWGFIGTILQWSTFAMVIIIFVLQIIWRIIKQITWFSPIYNADAAVEIILSAILFLKLCLNTWLCTAVPMRRVIVSYSGFVLALMFSFGVGMGNLLSFKFTESLLGRFLEALEFYTLVFSTLLVTFYPHKVVDVRPAKPKHVPSFFLIPSNPRLSSFRVTPPVVSTPQIPPRAATGSLYDELPTSSRESSASRLSSWLAVRSRRISARFRSIHDSDQVRLWNHNEAERGESSLNHPYRDMSNAIVEDDMQSSSVSIIDYVEVERPNLPFAPVAYGSLGASERTSQYSENPRSGVHPFATVPMHSPTYGLDALVKKTQASFLDGRNDPRRILALADRPASGVSSLIRQQDQLDKSIAGLLLEGEQILDTKDDSSSESILTFDNRSKRSKFKSTSAPSEISLSQFPRPPWEPECENQGAERVRPSVSTTSTARPGKQSKVMSIAVDNVPFELVPPIMPAATADSKRQLSVPYSDTDYEMLMSAARTSKFNSHGTQYDVTSFIGDLTSPGHKKESSSSSTKLTDISSSGDEAGATIVTLDRSNPAKYVRPMYVNQDVDKVGVGRRVAESQDGLPQRIKIRISAPQIRDGDSMSEEFETPRPAPPVVQRSGPLGRIGRK